MRTLGLALGLPLLAIVAVVVLWPAPRTGPVAIAYGRDTCAHCRMHLTQPGFAGELRDARGVLTKYDDVGCMLRAMAALHSEVPEAWVEDHVTAELVPLLATTLVQLRPSDTPMGSGLVAFANADAAAAFARAHDGETVPLEALLHDPTRLARDDQALAERPREVQAR
jgi:hypothetical protein